MTSTTDTLRNLSDAGANVLPIASYEWERVRGQAIDLAQNMSLSLRVWSQSGRLLRVEDDGVLNPDDSEAH